MESKAHLRNWLPSKRETTPLYNSSSRQDVRPEKNKCSYTGMFGSRIAEGFLSNSIYFL